jgi:predicted RNase H-like HicB family nuclease
VTLIRVTVHLRNGYRSQWFPCRLDETVDYRGRRSFEALCPTNYLHESGKTVREAIGRLSDVIEARYEGEGLHDLMREMPKCPIMASIDVSSDHPHKRGTAVVSPVQGGFEASIIGSAVTVQGKDPYVALRRAEESLATAGLSSNSTPDCEPVFCMVDVPLPLLEGTSIHRFLVAISSPSDDLSSSSFVARAPQAGDISCTSSGFDEALRDISDAIALEFREKSLGEVQELLQRQVFLATVELPEK